MSSENENSNLEHLFVAALGVFNRALDAHRGSAPCDHILAECTEKHQDRLFGVRLYIDDPGEPVIHLGVRFHNGLFEPVSVNEPVEGPVWEISVEKLKKIVAAEDQYVSNPEKLPWDWLAARIEGEKQLVSKG
jgi:hypothetical protein